LIAASFDMMLDGSETMDSLHPAVADISPQGLVIAEDVTAEDLGLTAAEERVSGPLAIHLEARLQENAITVSGTMEGTVVRQCVRCLTDYDDPLDLTIYADYLRHAGGTPKAGDSSQSQYLAQRAKDRRREPVEDQSDEEDEMYYYQGDHIDLAPMLREQVILAAPMQPLCREDCAGLCGSCGQNLNEQRCACAPQGILSPFRILRDQKGRRDGGR
jgi:uncharacterized protein